MTPMESNPTLLESTIIWLQQDDSSSAKFSNWAGRPAGRPWKIFLSNLKNSLIAATPFDPIYPQLDSGNPPGSRLPPPPGFRIPLPMIPATLPRSQSIPLDPGYHPGSGYPPCSRLASPGSRLPSPGPWLPCPGSRLPTPGSRLPSPGSRLPSPAALHPG